MKRLIIVTAILGTLAQGTTRAGWLDVLLGNKSTNQPAGSSIAALSQEQVISALKEALGKGVEHAVSTLGTTNGFLSDLRVKIPVPEPLQKVERSLRLLGQDKLADDFIATMNHAAEQAVPQAASVLGNAVQQMTLADAKAILTSTNTAATEFFRRTSSTNLYARFYPIVAKATQAVGVTSAYKNMMDKAGFASAFLGDKVGDLDAYVTQKSLDGLFLKIADEEKRIRENPVARTTDLLQKVFGAIQR